jgi:hypothetical protein
MKLVNDVSVRGTQTSSPVELGQVATVAALCPGAVGVQRTWPVIGFHVRLLCIQQAIWWSRLFRSYHEHTLLQFPSHQVFFFVCDLCLIPQHYLVLFPFLPFSVSSPFHDSGVLPVGSAYFVPHSRGMLCVHICVSRVSFFWSLIFVGMLRSAVRDRNVVRMSTLSGRTALQRYLS